MPSRGARVNSLSGSARRRVRTRIGIYRRTCAIRLRNELWPRTRVHGLTLIVLTSSECVHTHKHGCIALAAYLCWANIRAITRERRACASHICRPWLRPASYSLSVTLPWYLRIPSFPVSIILIDRCTVRITDTCVTITQLAPV